MLGRLDGEVSDEPGSFAKTRGPTHAAVAIVPADIRSMSRRVRAFVGDCCVVERADICHSPGGYVVGYRGNARSNMRLGKYDPQCSSSLVGG